MQNKLNMQNMQKKLTFPTDRINLLSDAIDTVSDVANAKVSHRDSKNFDACFLKTAFL